MKKIIDYFDLSEDCLFSAFLAPVWVYAFPDREELDHYFLLNYGIRPAFDTLLDKYADNSGKITGDDLKKLADLVYHVNGKKWERYFKVYNADYSPIENTDFIEEVTEDNGNVRVIDSDRAANDSNEVRNSGTSRISDDSDLKRYGFNSSNAVGDSETSRDTSTTDSSITTTSDARTDTDDTTITDDEDKKMLRRKHGNIGVTENTTMMEHDVSFWSKWSFIDQVCKDICNTIALSIY